jgi:hypothetical protein
VTLKPIDCLLVACDGCGESLTDADMDTVIHFDDATQAAQHLGGWVDGRLYEGDGWAVLPDGSHYCWDCKTLPHAHVPGYPIDTLCARCGEVIDDRAPELPPADVPGQIALSADRPTGPDTPGGHTRG